MGSIFSCDRYSSYAGYAYDRFFDKPASRLYSVLEAADEGQWLYVVRGEFAVTRNAWDKFCVCTRWVFERLFYGSDLVQRTQDSVNHIFEHPFEVPFPFLIDASADRLTLPLA